MLPTNSSTRSRKLLKAFKIFSFIVITGGIFFWLQSDFWKVKKIRCSIDNIDCSDNILADLMSFSLGKNILFLSPKTIKQKVEEQYPQLENVGIFKNLPDSLTFSLTTRQPQIAIQAEKLYLVDKAGVVLGVSQDLGNYPLIIFDTQANIRVGQNFSQPEVIKTINLFTDLKLRLLEPKVAKIISPNQVEITLKDDIQIIFSLRKDPSPQLDSLQFILSRAKIEGKALKSVDLRFEKPLISDH